ncbi:GFA family protein [Halieaceae bacterium IMCC14734]|uniref:GFA family protein n=1 Tax=Candidatus Litorirhabdus singularis TaxID=2518993 RepID=A0ABT3TDJ5_9GAMM|nr:GFA family protein [Candidatus Litorirhabdus singularis]
MIQGGCLCGKVRYTYHGDICEIAICHCSQCRQAQGGAFATNSPIDADKLEISGKEFIRELESNENKVRAFCSNCGSPLYSARKDLPHIKRLRIGSVETPFICENKYHIFSASKASWYEIIDSYPQFERHKNE